MKVYALLKRWYEDFRKPRTTIFIILVLLVLFVIGLLIPQKRLFMSAAQYNQWKLHNPTLSVAIESLKLNDMYVAPVTLFFLGLFFLNLFVVLVYRVPNILRRSYLLDKFSGLSNPEHIKKDESVRKILIECRDVGSADELMIRTVNFFQKRLWSVFRDDFHSAFITVKNRFSPLGFLLFHVSFLFCLIGGLLVVYTRFSGNLTLTEGEEFYADMARFRVIKNDPILFKALPDFGIKIRKVSPSYEGNTATDLDIAMDLKYGDALLDVMARINEPVSRGPLSILPVSVGISPLFVLRGGGGQEITGGFFSLNVLKGDEDSFEFQDMPYKIYVRFFPDFVEQNGQGSTRSLDIKNPVFKLTVEQAGKKIYENFVRPGESANFEGLELYCNEIRYWVDFLVVREYGNTLLFVGFFIGALGLIMRLVFYQKTVHVYIEYHNGVCTLFMTGRSEYYSQTFREEFERIYAALECQLAELNRQPQSERNL